MHVLFLNKFLTLKGGSERVLFDEVDALKANGHSVDVFSRADGDAVEDGATAYLPPALELNRGISFSGVNAAIEIVYSRRVRRALGRYLDDHHVDIAHCHNIYGLLTTSVLDELKARGIPTVLTLHDYKIICANYMMLHEGEPCERCRTKVFFWPLVLKCVRGSFVDSAIYATENTFNSLTGKYRNGVDRLIAVSNFIKRKHVEFGWPEERISYLPNSILTPQYQPCFEHSGYFLYVGRLAPEKGISSLIGAFLRGVVPGDHRLVVVGNGPIETELRAQVAASANPSAVEFRGFLQGSELEAAFRHATAVVVPSVCYENCPLVILEAMAYGKLVVGSRIGGIPELINHKKDGYLYNAGNHRELAQVLRMVAEMPSERLAEMGRTGRQKIERIFSQEGHYRGLIKIYESVLQKSKDKE